MEHPGWWLPRFDKDDLHERAAIAKECVYAGRRKHTTLGIGRNIKLIKLTTRECNQTCRANDAVQPKFMNFPHFQPWHPHKNERRAALRQPV